jgi:hypothetical protein
MKLINKIINIVIFSLITLLVSTSNVYAAGVPLIQMGIAFIIWLSFIPCMLLSFLVPNSKFINNKLIILIIHILNIIVFLVVVLSYLYNLEFFILYPPISTFSILLFSYLLYLLTKERKITKEVVNHIKSKDNTRAFRVSSVIVIFILIAESIGIVYAIPYFGSFFRGYGENVPLLIYIIVLSPIFIWLLPILGLGALIYNIKTKKENYALLATIIVCGFLFILITIYGMFYRYL